MSSVKSQYPRTPALRFPEFSGEWEEKRLRDISVFHDEKRIPLKQEDRQKRKGDYDYYGASGVIDSIDDYIFEGEYMLLGEDGANIVDRSSRLAFIASGKFWVNNHAHVIEAKGSTYFLCEALERLNYEKYNTGTAQPKLNAKVVKSIVLDIPSLPEQQKIADFLTSVDAWIENLEGQHEKLVDYKRGLMQKIFSQEIRFRADDGSELPAWKEKRLGDLICLEMGQSPKSDTYNEQKDGVPLIQGNADIENRKTSPRRYTSEPTKMCKKGDIILSVRAPIGEVSISCHNACIGRGVASVTNNTISEARFLYQFLLSYESMWHRVGQGSTFSAINGSDIRGVKVFTPSLPEQRKIADFLTSVDELIESKEQEIEKAKEWKRGLMQGLFV